MPFSKGTSENTILFFQGGHNHDGTSSSLIDISKYSIYDFVVGKIGSSQRQITQQRNFDNLKTVISNIITTDILGPAGVRLGPNSVQSVNIAAGAVTAEELAANIVLVNNIIQSNNYVANTSGWAIHGNGFAEFDIAVIRGTITANSIFINTTNYWNSNGTFSVGAGDNRMLYNGTNLELTGKVTATSGQIAGWAIAGDNLVTGGNFSGDMTLGKFSGSGNGGGVAISGPADGNNNFGISKLIGGQLLLTTSVENGPHTTYGSSGVIYRYGTQTFEFYYNSSSDQLWAYIDGQPYCIQQCSTSPPPVSVSPTPSPGPEPGPEPGPGPGPGPGPEPGPGPGPEPGPGPDPSPTPSPCACCVGQLVFEQRCYNNGLQLRSGIYYDGSCGAGEESGTECSGQCTGCSCPSFTQWNDWTDTGIGC